MHRNLPYSPGVVIWMVTGCMGQWRQWGSKHEGSTLKFVCPVVADDGKVRLSSTSTPYQPCHCLFCVTPHTVESNFSPIQNLTSLNTAVVCDVCFFLLNRDLRGKDESKTEERHLWLTIRCELESSNIYNDILYILYLSVSSVGLLLSVQHSHVNLRRVTTKHRGHHSSNGRHTRCRHDIMEGD